MITQRVIDLIESTPNDQELGAEIRKIYWELKGKDRTREKDLSKL